MFKIIGNFREKIGGPSKLLGGLFYTIVFLTVGYPIYLVLDTFSYYFQKHFIITLAILYVICTLLYMRFGKMKRQ